MPGNLELRNLSRDNLLREVGRATESSKLEGQALQRPRPAATEVFLRLRHGTLPSVTDEGPLRRICLFIQSARDGSATLHTFDVCADMYVRRMCDVGARCMCDVCNPGVAEALSMRDEGETCGLLHPTLILSYTNTDANTMIS